MLVRVDPSNTVGRVEGRGVGGVRQDGRVSEIPETDESAEQVQPETPADVPEILTMIAELAAYEKEPDSAVATAEQA